MSMRVFSSPACLEHEVPGGYPELPARLESVLQAMERSGYDTEQVDAHPDADRAIAAVHDESYISRFQKFVATGESFIDTGDNPLSPGSWRAAKAAIDSVLAATDWVLEKPNRRGVAAVRPPGHHAEHAMAMGFCYFNNVAVAAEYILSTQAARRLAIVDHDVHHGNGTQHLFEDRGDVLYVSVHQHPFYPGTGTAGERGRGDGLGATLNVPLPAGSGDAVYEEVFQKVVLPTLREYEPEVLLISAGFDAWQGDPVGGMQVSAEAYQAWGRWLRQIADEHCSGRIVVTLEGGYDLRALGALTVAHCRGLEEDVAAT